MALKGEIGWMGKPCPDHPKTKLHTKIMHSNAGFFIGTSCPECCEPVFSRESHYYASRDAVLAAFERGDIQWRDSNWHPDPMQVLEMLEAMDCPNVAAKKEK